MHYPLSIKYEELNINNKKVINAISDHLNGYAFIIESFEYDFNDNSLNFNALIVGYSNIPYSKVFINNKGVGSKYNKLIKNTYDVYDSEIIQIRRKYGEAVSVSNFTEYMERANKIAKEHVIKRLLSIGATKIRVVSDEYPYSLFDIQYLLDNNIYYGIIFSTYTKSNYFTLTSWQNNFINVFDNVSIFMVKDIDSNNEITIINKNDLNKYSVSINMIRFVK